MIHRGDVAGVEPTVAECELRLLGLVPVAGHDLRSARDEFAGLAERDLVAQLVDAFDLRQGIGTPIDPSLARTKGLKLARARLR